MYKRVLLATMGALLALLIGAAGAYFTAQVQVPDNIITAGTVSISAEPTSAALSVDALAPGATTTRTLTVVNDGTLTSDLVITPVKKAGITEFYEELTCKVTCGGIDLYSGPLHTLRTDRLRLAPGARGDVKFDISLPASTPDAVAGDYVKLSLYLDAEQVH